MPVVNGLRLAPGQVIGLNVTCSNYEGSNGAEFSGVWTSLWDGANDSGRDTAAGVYYPRATDGRGRFQRKLVLF